VTLRAASGTSRHAPIGCSNDLVVAPEMQHNIRALRQHTEAAAFNTREAAAAPHRLYSCRWIKFGV